jgi:hypothetical protein
MQNPFSRSKCFPLIRLDLALHMVPQIRYLGFTLEGRRVPWLRWRTCPLASPNEVWYEYTPSTLLFLDRFTGLLYCRSSTICTQMPPSRSTMVAPPFGPLPGTMYGLIFMIISYSRLLTPLYQLQLLIFGCREPNSGIANCFLPHFLHKLCKK